MGYCRFAAILPLLWCAGCCWMLPPGDPPENEIVDIHPPAERDRRGAENDAVTSLAGYTLQNCPGAAISIQAPAARAGRRPDRRDQRNPLRCEGRPGPARL